MNWIVLLEKLFSSKSPSHSDGDSLFIEVLEFIRLLRSAGSNISSQASLHGQLILIEIKEEKNRLVQMIIMMLLSFVVGICTLIFIGILVVALSWDTPYRIHSIVALIGACGLGIGLIIYRIKVLVARSNQAFIATRRELSADLALLRSHL